MKILFISILHKLKIKNFKKFLILKYLILYLKLIIFKKFLIYENIIFLNQHFFEINNFLKLTFFWNQ